MFSRGDQLWLCISFHALPLEAVLSIRPLTSGAAEPATEGRHHPHSLNNGPLTSGAAEPATCDDSDSADAGLPDDLVGRPVAVLEKQRVLVVNSAAAALGVTPGQAAATARTLADGIRLLERDQTAEGRCLEQLCCWAYGLSPTLYPCRDDSLLLEIGSCLMLYGGIEALLSRVREELSRRGYSYRFGLGPTPKAALLFTRPLEARATGSGAEALHHPPDSEHRPLEACGAGTLEARLAPLPLCLLENFPREVDALAKAGLWTFGDILALPHRALARRCGRDFVHYLNQLLGTAEDLVPDFSPPQQFSDDYWFGYEVKANQELLPAIQLLLQSLCRFLRNTQLQTQQVQWELYGINRIAQRLTVHCSLSQANWQEWYQLTRLKIEQLRLEMSIEGIGLCCHRLTPGNADTDDLFQQAGQREPLHCLLDRLKSRLGLQSVQKIACRDEHLPEFAGYSSPDTRPTVTGVIDREQRPFWLMPEPQRLRELAGLPCWNGRLTLVEGPERIEDNWWDQAVSRDYYVAQL